MTAAAYQLDPDDPRAHSEEQWATMDETERARVVATLPTDMPWDLHPPEGDSHREPKDTARDALGECFRRKGKRDYVSSELVSRLENLVDELIDARDAAVRRNEELELELARLRAELERRGD